MKRYFILSAIAALLLTSCNSIPDAYFYSDKISAEVGEDVYFTNASQNSSEFEWDFGDGTWADSWDPIHSWSATGTFTVVLSAYSDNGFVDKAYQEIEIYSPTMLEIEVLEWNDEYPVQGASVILYPTMADWDEETNAIAEGFTNASGKVIFTQLASRAYYVDVWHSTHNNYAIRTDFGDQYISTGVLSGNELNQFVAWVDYTGSKSEAASRDRTVLSVSKDRTTTHPVSGAHPVIK